MKINPAIDDAPFIPLRRTKPKPLTAEQVKAQIDTIKKMGATHAQACEVAREANEKNMQAEMWHSPQYVVLVYEATVADGWPPMTWLSIRRDDREPVRDWRHMQHIKNQICGRDREGVQLFPSDKRLVDTANQYHLFVLKERGQMFPFGFTERAVTDTAAEPIGGKQRAGAGQ